MRSRRIIVIVLTGCMALIGRAVSADTVAVIGTGNVASALGPEFAQQGHQIIYGSRNPDRPEIAELVAQSGPNASATGQVQAVSQADIVVLAVPGMVVEDVVAGLGDLSGKLIIDPTNPTRELANGLREHARETSNGEIIQDLAPDAYVVKAFNTMNFRTMIEPGGPVTVPLVGNDADAKAKVAELVEGMGLEAVDLGPIQYAHEVEGMLVVWVNARVQGTPFDYHFRKR